MDETAQPPRFSFDDEGKCNKNHIRQVLERAGFDRPGLRIGIVMRAGTDAERRGPALELDKWPGYATGAGSMVEVYAPELLLGSEAAGKAKTVIAVFDSAIPYQGAGNGTPDGRLDTSGIYPLSPGNGQDRAGS